MEKKKILLVDDEKALTYSIKLLLESYQFEVETAHDGQAALDISRRKKYDLIILDLMLPSLDGHKICRMLKFDVKYRHIPIIILTARYKKADEDLSYEVGADAFITKPFELQTLINTVKKLLNIEAVHL